jgi:hypothetical protein
VNNVQPIVTQFSLQKFYKLRVRLQHDQHGVRSHSAENFPGKGADARPVLENHPSTIPVDFRKNVVNQKTRARYQAAEHFGMLKEIPPKE